MPKPIVNYQNIAVKSEYRYFTVKDSVMQLRPKMHHRQIARALQNVEIEVNPGESFGLVDHSGSGQSTYSLRTGGSIFAI